MLDFNVFCSSPVDFWSQTEVVVTKSQAIIKSSSIQRVWDQIPGQSVHKNYTVASLKIT